MMIDPATDYHPGSPSIGLLDFAAMKTSRAGGKYNAG